mmetsp:Transcript_111586/g.197719  ORF Transcript_111586/g.197719 Transcript_111586/m.197719 type:complete len:434 (-) Transcript_111586:297-1598(-)
MQAVGEMATLLTPPRLVSQKSLAPIDTTQANNNATEDKQDEEDLTPLDRFKRQRSSGFGTPSNSPYGSKDGFDTTPFCRQRSSESTTSHQSRGSRIGSYFRQPSCDGSARSRSTSVRPPSLGPSTTTCRRAASIKCALIVDWDDTLFPTTWIREDCGLDWRVDIGEQLCSSSLRSKHIMDCLQRYGEHAAAFLKEAERLGHELVIVTLANRDWVTLSVKRFCPTLLKALEDCKAKIVYAQEYADAAHARSRVPSHSESQERQFWTDVKASAIRALLAEHDVVWTDVLSIGDSEFERQGTKQVCDELNTSPTQAGAGRRVHTKVLKSLESPTIEELIAQHSVFKRWLPFMIDLNGDMDIEIDTSDDDLLNDLDKLVTGRICGCGNDLSVLPNVVCCPACDAQRPRGPALDTTEELSWAVLAGMNDERYVESMGG